MKSYTDLFKLISARDSTDCSICSSNIPNSLMILHSINHFNHFGFSFDTCGFCNKSIETEDVESILEHMIYEHNIKSECPICYRNTESMDSLYYHLQENMKIVYHCNNPKCLWMSDKESQFLKHLKKSKHLKQFNFIETIFCCQFFHESLPYKNFKIINKENTDICKDENFQNINSKENKLKISNCLYYFTYSEKVLEKFLSFSKPLITENLKFKLKSLEQFLWSILSTEYPEKFCCESCNFISNQKCDDMKKHILRYHCMISLENLSFVVNILFCNFEDKLLMESKMLEKMINEKLNLNDLQCNSNYKTKNDSHLIKINKFQKKNWELIEKMNFLYSKKALKSICLIEKCMDKFHALQQKMDMFTTYQMHIFKSSIHITYVCSKCEKFSLLVLDIITHVLNCHANFNSETKKMKQIALACSKLDENYSLFPSKILKEKWLNNV